MSGIDPASKPAFKELTVRKARLAFTLMETVLVMAILLILAALAFPCIDSLQAGPRLSAATDLVRARLNETRTHAIQDRMPYRFAVKDGTGAFKIAPDTSDYWSDGSTPAKDDTAWVFEGSLPERVVFAPSEEGSTSGSWHTLVTFQADGTAADDVDMTFKTNGAPPTTLRLRGSTGSVTTVALAVVLDVH
jgi:Tfp pilus assembly protein FimT